MLILPIKKLWFDMILSGEKLEEYRQIKTYYRTRFFNKGFLDSEGNPTDRQEWILFRNGYSKGSPSFEAFCGLSIKTGNPEWGAEPNEKYYVLKILKIKIAVISSC